MSDWRERARCRGLDPELFFDDDRPGRNAFARRVCRPCPVRTACLNWALTVEGDMAAKARAGVFGGLGPFERWHENRRRKKKAAA